MKYRLSKPMAFLLVVLLIYMAAGLYDAERAIAALSFSVSMAGQILPVLALVFAIMLLSNVLLKSQWVKTHLGQNSGAGAWLVSVIAGIFSPGPIYPWLTLLKELKEKGMRPALIAVFLYSRGIKLPMLPLLIHYFGLAYALLLLLYIPLFALLSGVLIEKLPGLNEVEK